MLIIFFSTIRVWPVIKLNWNVLYCIFQYILWRYCICLCWSRVNHYFFLDNCLFFIVDHEFGILTTTVSVVPSSAVVVTSWGNWIWTGSVVLLLVTWKIFKQTFKQCFHLQKIRKMRVCHKTCTYVDGNFLRQWKMWDGNWRFFVGFLLSIWWTISWRVFISFNWRFLITWCICILYGPMSCLFFCTFSLMRFYMLS
jgi:hypothetical protein